MSEPQIPSAGTCWATWIAWIEQFGTCYVSPSGIRLALNPEITCEDGWTACIELGKDELHRYVTEYVEARWAAGLDAGLEDGLPNPLTDSLFEGLGVQETSVATYVLDGLDLVQVAAESSADSS